MFSTSLFKPGSFSLQSCRSYFSLHLSKFDDMKSTSSLIPFVTLAMVAGAFAAAVGPVADLTISDMDVSPDGFTRAAVVVNGAHPAPLIRGNKASNYCIYNINTTC